MTSSRTVARWRVPGQMVLLLVVLAWMPLGAREADVVSTVLPALHPAAVTPPVSDVDVVLRVDGGGPPTLHRIIERFRRTVDAVVAPAWGPVTFVLAGFVVALAARAPRRRPPSVSRGRAPPLLV